MDKILKISNQNDTIFHKVEIISDGKGTFFSTDNPFWFVITLILGGLISYLFSLKQKKTESITEAKKIFLEKRIEKHSELFKIASESNFITGNQKALYHKLFEDYNKMTEWYDKLLKFYVENQVFLSHKVNFEITLQSNLRQKIVYLYELNSMTDNDLKTFAIRNHKSFSILFESLRKSIADFFENEINLKYKFTNLSNEDLIKGQKKNRIL